MWVIFLLSAMSIVVCGLIIAYIGNKVIMAIEKDRKKMNEEREKGETDK